MLLRRRPAATAPPAGGELSVWSRVCTTGKTRGSRGRPTARGDCFCQLLGGDDFSAGKLGLGGDQISYRRTVGEDVNGFFEGFQVLDGEQDCSRTAVTVTVTRSCWPRTRATSSDRWAFTSASERGVLIVTSMTRVRNGVQRPPRLVSRVSAVGKVQSCWIGLKLEPCRLLPVE